MLISVWSRCSCSSFAIIVGPLDRFFHRFGALVPSLMRTGRTPSLAGSHCLIAWSLGSIPTLARQEPARRGDGFRGVFGRVYIGKAKETSPILGILRTRRTFCAC